jgi:hypothetical protein
LSAKAKLTRRAALAMLGASGVLALGYALRGVFVSPNPRPTDGGMMGNVGPADMSIYMEMFNRHREISRVVEEIPGGVRTTTESESPDLVALLHTHVPSMYSHLDQRAEITCMSQSLPTLFRHADRYSRRLTLTPKGVIAEETADDPNLTQAIRSHAREVTGFVREGMPAMMGPMMGGR